MSEKIVGESATGKDIEHASVDVGATQVISPSPPGNPLDHYAKRFLLKIWASRGSRFVANRRLRRKNHACQMVLSFFSLVVVAAGVGLLILPHDYKKLADFISVLSIDASVFILVLSNLEFAKNYAVEADRMLKGGQALSPLHDQLEMAIRLGTLTPDGLDQFMTRYNDILNEFEVNHEEIDYALFRSMHPKGFGIRNGLFLRRMLCRIRFFFHIWGLYIICITIPPCIIAAVMYGLPALSVIPWFIE